MARPSRYPKELMDRGVRLALEGERPIAHIAQDLGIGRRRCASTCAARRSMRVSARG
jgi:hypothetical protein